MYAEKSKKETLEMAFSMQIKFLKQFMLALFITAAGILLELYFLEYGYWSSDFNIIVIILLCLEALLAFAYITMTMRWKKMIKLAEDNPEVPLHFDVSKNNTWILKVGDISVGIVNNIAIGKISKKSKHKMDEMAFHLSQHSFKSSQAQEIPFQ